VGEGQNKGKKGREEEVTNGWTAIEGKQYSERVKKVLEKE